MPVGNAEQGASENHDAEAPVAVYEGVPYAERDAGTMKLDLFVPAVEEPPLVVYVHGGGWVAETRDNIPDPERYAAEWGCAIASVSYRLAEIPEAVDSAFPVDPANPTPRGVFPDQLVDVKAAIRWLRAHADEYGYDAERVAAWGASAGGHLAALAGVVEDVTDLAGDAYSTTELQPEVAPAESGAVQAVVDWYGASDFTVFPGQRENPESLLVGGAKADRKAEFDAVSPISHVSADSPPFLLMHGREDVVIPAEQSDRLYDALTDAGVDAVYYDTHDLGHGFADGPDAIESERTAMGLLERTPTPAQSIYESTTIETGGTGTPLVDGKPPASADAIGQFLDATLS